MRWNRLPFYKIVLLIVIAFGAAFVLASTVQAQVNVPSYTTYGPHDVVWNDGQGSGDQTSIGRFSSHRGEDWAMFEFKVAGSVEWQIDCSPNRHGLTEADCFPNSQNPRGVFEGQPGWIFKIQLLEDACVQIDIGGPGRFMGPEDCTQQTETPTPTATATVTVEPTQVPPTQEPSVTPTEPTQPPVTETEVPTTPEVPATEVPPKPPSSSEVLCSYPGDFGLPHGEYYIFMYKIVKVEVGSDGKATTYFNLVNDQPWGRDNPYSILDGPEGNRLVQVNIFPIAWENGRATTYECVPLAEATLVPAAADEDTCLVCPDVALCETIGVTRYWSAGREEYRYQVLSSIGGLTRDLTLEEAFDLYGEVPVMEACAVCLQGNLRTNESGETEVLFGYGNTVIDATALFVSIGYDEVTAEAMAIELSIIFESNKTAVGENYIDHVWVELSQLEAAVNQQ